MGELLLPRPSQQSLPCGGSSYPQAAASVAVYQAQSEMAGEETFPDGILLPSAWFGQSHRTDRQPSVGETVSFLRALDAGNPHVQCDEREQETELRQTGLRRRGESLANRHRETKVTAPVLDSTSSACASVRSRTGAGMVSRLASIESRKRHVPATSPRHPALRRSAERSRAAPGSSVLQRG